MTTEMHYQADIEAILSHRYDNGADFWTTPDKRLIKVPFLQHGMVIYVGLGMTPQIEFLKHG